MIKKVLITGDVHSKIEQRLQYIKDTMPEYLPEETAVIILGDFGANYYLSKHDWKIKHHAANLDILSMRFGEIMSSGHLL